jgi:hypothetical protein
LLLGRELKATNFRILLVLLSLNGKLFHLYHQVGIAETRTGGIVEISLAGNRASDVRQHPTHKRPAGSSSGGTNNHWRNALQVVK